jgi:lipid-A-disaccharide synthase
MTPLTPARPPHIFLVAGEESGDRLGAALIAALRQGTEGQVRVSGIGGTHMAREGMVSPFALGDLAIIGVSAIPRRLPRILRRIREAADAAVAADPDVLVIIDSPDFTHRVARRVRARAPKIPIVDYVCPSVWAWRPGRARKMRSYVDLVLGLLPFEPAAMQKLSGPRCIYVGHPLAEEVPRLRPSSAEEERRRCAPPVLIVMPGSRSGEIRRFAAIFGETVGRVVQQTGPLDVFVPTVPRLVEAVKAAIAKWPVAAHVVVKRPDKEAAFRVARAALTKSGTSTLELALAGIPMVAAYTVTLVEELIVRAFVTAPSAILTNLVLGENVVPEFLQRDCTVENLSSALAKLIGDTPERRHQVDAFARLDDIMQIGRAVPSARAAAFVIETAVSHAPLSGVPRRSEPA